jgi:hypothetical protein
VGTMSLEARNIRLVNIITYIIEESKLISENMSPNVIHCTISFIIACVSFSELENDTWNQAELNEIQINENN